MAYLSEDDITGQVILNLHTNNNEIINNTNINLDRPNIKFHSEGISSNSSIKKFSNTPISNDIGVFINDNELKIGYDTDFTISNWIYKTINGTAESANFHTIVADSDYWIGLRNANNNFQVTAQSLSGSSVALISSYDTISSIRGSWYHTAITKKGLNLYWFVNGKMIYHYTISESNAKNEFFNPSGYQHIHTRVWNYNSSGKEITRVMYSDDVVFVKDQCLWTADFTVPTEPLIGQSKFNMIIYPQNLNKNNGIKIN